VRLLEDLRERRVADLAVERDHVPARRPERRERVAVGLPRRDLVADVVARQLELAALEPVRLAVRRRCDLNDDVPQSAELLDRRVGIGVGWPSSMLPNCRYVSSSSSPIAPAPRNIAYSSVDAWPFEKVRRSFVGLSGASKS
jgi:hypothetical protein